MKCPRCDGTGELHGDDALFTSVGMTIARLRGEKGLTQHELANQMRIGRSQLANMEMGRGVNSLATIADAAKALGVELKELMP